MKNIFGSKYLNPLTDFGLKKIFIAEENKDILIDLLNELIVREDKIVDLVYQRPAERLGDKKSIFDIYCKTDKEEYCVVEIQKMKQVHFKDRSIYHSTFPIQEQIVSNGWSYGLQAIYTIAILDFTLFNEVGEDKNCCREEVKLMRTSTKTVFYDKLSYIYIELPKFSKSLNELKTKFDCWMYILQRLSTLHDRPKELKGKIFDKLFKIAEINSLTPQEVIDYNKSILEYSDVKDAANYLREEGFQYGKKEGHKEALKNITKILLLENKSIDTIVKYTGLTAEEIEALK